VTCSQCAVNYELKQDECVCSLHEGCNTFENFNCGPGQFINNGECKSCRQGCLKCTDLDTCEECFNTFHLLEGLCTIT
jgi:hypothetical protein